jgi:hypothetical protein
VTASPASAVAVRRQRACDGHALQTTLSQNSIVPGLRLPPRRAVERGCDDIKAARRGRNSDNQRQLEGQAAGSDPLQHALGCISSASALLCGNCFPVANCIYRM